MPEPVHWGFLLKLQTISYLSSFNIISYGWVYKEPLMCFLKAQQRDTEILRITFLFLGLVSKDIMHFKGMLYIEPKNSWKSGLFIE